MACMPICSAAPVHHPAAQEESLLGSGTSLFLLKSPDHILCSQVLNGVTRPIPQLGFPVSKRNLSVSIPFLAYWDHLCCDCSVKGACAIQWCLMQDSGTPEAADVQELPGGLHWNTLGLWTSVQVA